MTREKIEARKAELRKAVQASLEQLERLRGAIQDCDYWLKQIETAPQHEQEADQELAA